MKNDDDDYECETECLRMMKDEDDGEFGFFKNDGKWIWRKN